MSLEQVISDPFLFEDESFAETVKRSRGDVIQSSVSQAPAWICDETLQAKDASGKFGK